ncbi:XdhC family protein [Streptomyces chartreusis]|uniref:XdhC family protein n=1 Tax=Streptomyces chartreusis TaxID=1969 RepID=UPI003D8D648D
MRDIAGTVAQWAAEGHRFAVATVVAVRGSAPREVGSSLAVRADGAVAGSVSGGCVEGDIHELAARVLATGMPARASYGYDPDDPFAVRLTCGGELDVHIQPFLTSPRFGMLAAVHAAQAGEPVALARVLDGTGSLAAFADRHAGSVGGPELDAAVVAEARAMLDLGHTGQRRFDAHGRCDPHGEVEILIESWNRKPTMLIFGAADFSAAVASIGRFLGYHVVVCDARPIFATEERFPDAHEVVVDWPHRYLARTPTDGRTVVCVLTHDAKFDIPLLTEALRRPLGYVGALGSRRTHADRLRRLAEAGLTEAELTRLRSPIGLDLGGRTPRETAVAIAAEIVALHRGGTTRPLTDSKGPIHHDVHHAPTA